MLSSGVIGTYYVKRKKMEVRKKERERREGGKREREGSHTCAKGESMS